MNNEIIIYCAIAFFAIILIYGVSFVNYAFENFKQAYLKYNVPLIDYPNAVEFVQKVSLAQFGGRIKVKIVNDMFKECFKPASFTIDISKTVAKSNSVSALSIVAHELGHAIQTLSSPKRVVSYTYAVALSKFVSALTFPFFLASVICFFAIQNMLWISILLVGIAVICFLFGLIVKLWSVRFEKEASNNALSLLMTYEEMDNRHLAQCQDILKKAKNTYLASFWRSMLRWTFLVR